MEVRKYGGLKEMSREELLKAFTDKKKEVDLYGENHFHDGG